MVAVPRQLEAPAKPAAAAVLRRREGPAKETAATVLLRREEPAAEATALRRREGAQQAQTRAPRPVEPATAALRQR